MKAVGKCRDSMWFLTLLLFGWKNKLHMAQKNFPLSSCLPINWYRSSGSEIPANDSFYQSIINLLISVIRSFIVSPMSLVDMHVQLISSIKCQMTMFTRVLICSRKMNALNMILSVDLLWVSFATDCAHKLFLVRTLLNNLWDILAKISYKQRDVAPPFRLC